MNVIAFSAVIKIRGVNPYVLVSRQRANTLRPGWRRPMPVIVRVNGQPREPWRINMMPTGSGSFYLYLHGIVRKVSGTAVGDKVQIELAFDDEYAGGPEVIPAWLAEALAQHNAAMENYGKLPPSRQKEIVRYMTNLKSDDARQRNLQRLLAVLGGTDNRFMGRDWRGGA